MSSSYYGDTSAGETDLSDFDMDEYSDDDDDSDNAMSSEKKTAREERKKIIYNRYGFPVRKEAPIDPQRRRELQRRENVRLDKWQEMFLMREGIGSSGNTQMVRVVNTRHNKLKSRIRKGVPDPLRGIVWQNLCQSSKKLAKNPNKYRKLLSSREQSPEEEQIWKDINRTFRDHSSFQEQEGALMKS